MQMKNILQQSQNNRLLGFSYIYVFQINANIQKVVLDFLLN